MSASAFPLAWPPAFPRSRPTEKGAFRTTLAGALNNVEGSLRRKALSKQRHPDMPGGSTEAMAELNCARDEAMREAGGR